MEKRGFNCRWLCTYTDLELSAHWLLCCSGPQGFGAKHGEKTDHGVWNPHFSLFRKATLSVTQSSPLCKTSMYDPHLSILKGRQ